MESQRRTRPSTLAGACHRIDRAAVRGPQAASLGGAGAVPARREVRPLPEGRGRIPRVRPLLSLRRPEPCRKFVRR